MTGPEDEPEKPEPAGENAEAPGEQSSQAADNESLEKQALDASEAENSESSASLGDADSESEKDKQADKGGVSEKEVSPLPDPATYPDLDPATYPEPEIDKQSDASAASDAGSSGNIESNSDSQQANDAASKITLTQHHVSHLLSDVLQDEAAPKPSGKGLRFPMILDLLLGLSLLVAVGGFTIGLFHMYVVHSAAQSISEQKYKAAIVILKGAPLPQFFARPGSDTEELLSKARYLDAMEKLESGTDEEFVEAMKEVSLIKPGSKYFTLAQELISDNTEPAPLMLKGGAETTETNPQPEDKNQSLLERTLKEDEHKHH